MFKYGSCQRGCGATVAFSHDDPDTALDEIDGGDDVRPHVCKETPVSAITPNDVSPSVVRVLASSDAPSTDVYRAVRDAAVAATKKPATVLAHIEPPPAPIKADPLERLVITEAERVKILEDACRQIVTAIGDDLSRAGLAGTPERYAKMMMQFFVDGDDLAVDEPRVFKSDSIDQLVIVDGLTVFSMCEHHLLPFRMTVDIGYLTNGQVLGLSKFGRIARRLGQRLTMQEVYVESLANAIEAATGSKNVIVAARGEHLCMQMRGARMEHRASSAALRGAFKTDAPARAEFYSLVTRR